jgi:hypothetical protein
MVVHVFASCLVLDSENLMLFLEVRQVPDDYFELACNHCMNAYSYNPISTTYILHYGTPEFFVNKMIYDSVKVLCGCCVYQCALIGFYTLSDWVPLFVDISDDISYDISDDTSDDTMGMIDTLKAKIYARMPLIDIYYQSKRAQLVYGKACLYFARIRSAHG